MKILNKERGSGKTTQLIYTSEVTGYPIVTYTEKQANNVSEQAKKLGCNIINPITITNIKTSKRAYQSFQYILLDEAELILQEALESYLGVDIVALTMSIPQQDMPNYEQF